MTKLLVFLAIVGIWLAVASAMRRRGGDPPAAQKSPQPQAESMVRCAHCGTYFPAREALLCGEHAYCCEEHRRQASENGA